jgi:hypothetical protein
MSEEYSPSSRKQDRLSALPPSSPPAATPDQKTAPQPGELYPGEGFEDYLEDEKRYFYEMILLD